jgi:hypothetical protein
MMDRVSLYQFALRGCQKRAKIKDFYGHLLFGAPSGVMAITAIRSHSGLSSPQVVTMVETSLGAQYLKAALARWREANPWANHIPWEQIPQRYRHEIELSARWSIAKSNPVGPAEGVIREIDELAA